MPSVFYGDSVIVLLQTMVLQFAEDILFHQQATNTVGYPRSYRMKWLRNPVYIQKVQLWKRTNEAASSNTSHPGPLQ